MESFETMAVRKSTVGPNPEGSHAREGTRYAWAKRAAQE